MGQYYKAIILAENGKYIRLWTSSYKYGNGSKLTEHSYIGNDYVSAFEWLLSYGQMFYMSRIVWAGDYAEPENLFRATDDNDQVPDVYDTTMFPYVVNHTKKLFVKKSDVIGDIHPLPLLVSEGNGLGGGDYFGHNKMLCGTWARDVISIEREKPDYEELICEFKV